MLLEDGEDAGQCLVDKRRVLRRTPDDRHAADLTVAEEIGEGLDLRDRDKTTAFFREAEPSHVLNCAAYVGGIQFGYKHPAELFHNNLLMTLNLFEAASASKVKFSSNHLGKWWVTTNGQIWMLKFSPPMAFSALATKVNVDLMDNSKSRAA